MIVDVLAYLACAVAVVAAGTRVWTTRGFARRDEIWTLCVGGSLVALAALLLAPATSSALGQIEADTGIDALKLLGDALRMAAAGAAGLLATRIRDNRAPSPAAWLRGLLVIEAALVASFFAAHFRTSADGSQINADAGFGIVYDSVRLLYPIASLGLFALAVWPFARGLPRGPARAGCRVLAFAALIGVAWSAWTVDDIVQLIGVGHQDTRDDVPSVVLEIAFVVAAAAGMTVTAWDPLVHRSVAWLRAARSYRAMAPLWHALCGPEARLQRPGSAVPPATPAGLAELLPVRPWQASMARYRRVIEIRDAQLSLRPYQPGGVAAEVWTPADEAAAILAGLRAFATADGRGEPVEAATAAFAARPGDPGDSIDAEARRLAEVSRAFVAARRGTIAAA